MIQETILLLDREPSSLQGNLAGKLAGYVPPIPLVDAVCCGVSREEEEGLVGGILAGRPCPLFCAVRWANSI